MQKNIFESQSTMNFSPMSFSELQSRFVDNASHNVGLLPSQCCDISDDADLDILECVLNACDRTSLPNIYVLLQLALTLPVTSCESERSFSQLKLIKDLTGQQ